GLSAVVVRPSAEVRPSTAAWADRVGRLAEPRRGVPFSETLRWSARHVLPYAFGVSGHGRLAGFFGLPAAYAGALVFPLAALGLASRRRERWAFLGLAAIGLALWGQVAGVLPFVARLPLLGLTLLHYFVFLAVFGLIAIAVLGVERLARGELRGAFVFACAASLGAIAALHFMVRPELLSLAMAPSDLSRRLFLQLLPLVLAPAAVLALAPARSAAALVAILLGARGLETAEAYPPRPARAFFPVPALLAAPRPAPGERLVGLGYALVPNISTLYEIEDARGYESIVLGRLRETYPLWCVEQLSWFNRVDDATRPFVSFLSVRYALAPPGAAAPAGWRTVIATRAGSLFAHPR